MELINKKRRIFYKPGYRAICVLMWIAAGISFVIFILNISGFLQSYHTFFDRVALTNAILWFILAVGFARCWSVFLVAFGWLFWGQWSGQIFYLINAKNLLQPQYVSVMLSFALTFVGLMALWFFVASVHQRNFERLKLHSHESSIKDIHKKYKWSNLMLFVFGLSAVVTLGIQVYVDWQTNLMFSQAGINFAFIRTWVINFPYTIFWVIIIAGVIKKYRVIFVLFFPISFYIGMTAINLNILHWNINTAFYMPARLLVLFEITVMAINIIGFIVFILESRKLKKQYHSSTCLRTKSHA